MGSTFELSFGICLFKLKVPLELEVPSQSSFKPSKLSKAYNFFTYLEKKLALPPL